MDEVTTVPLAAYESLATRFSRIIKWLIFGWVLSVIALGLVLVISFSYSEEVITDTVTQESESYGSNLYAGGDYYGDEADGDADEDNAPTGDSVDQ